MTIRDHDFDPDDNFAHGVHDSPDIDEEAAVEALAWQFLLLVNPGDEDAALQQFGEFQEALGDAGEEPEPADLLRAVTDWKSGFHLPAGDARGVVEALTELAARWNLDIDWGVEDPTDDEFLSAVDAEDLLATAYDRLREHGYLLWARDCGDDALAGWITLARDAEAVRVLSPALGLDLRPASA